MKKWETDEIVLPGQKIKFFDHAFFTYLKSIGVDPYDVFIVVETKPLSWGVFTSDGKLPCLVRLKDSKGKEFSIENGSVVSEGGYILDE
jgi:hypothetical protein